MEFIINDFFIHVVFLYTFLFFLFSQLLAIVLNITLVLRKKIRFFEIIIIGLVVYGLKETRVLERWSI